MKKFISMMILATVAGTGTLYAQYAGDALRFSQGDYGSSARFKGLGGAQIGLGGDISSLGGNPAGLGMFTRSELSITPEFNNSMAKSSYLGQQTDQSKSQLSLGQAGVVFYSPIRKRAGSDLNKGALSIVWGIGYNRNNDFSANYRFEGQNTQNSIADNFSELATGRAESDFLNGSLEAMAYDNYLIDDLAGNPTQYQPATSQTNYQQNYDNRTGSTSELNLAAGINISNQVYFGASLGFVNIRYDRNFEYIESGQNISTDPTNVESGNDYVLSYRTNQLTDGRGINGRFGLLFKPTNAVRIGATFQSPTWLNIQDNYSEVLNTQYTGNTTTTYNNTPTNYPIEYNLRTPYKGSLGASIVIGNNALISGDIDYVDYASMRFSQADNNSSINVIDNNNADVQDLYTSAINYRVGAEYKLGLLSLRAGLGINGSPRKDDDDNNFQSKYYSGGLGYRVNNYYIDLAYQRVESNSSYSPYTLADFSEPVANTDFARNNVFLTFGVRF